MTKMNILVPRNIEERFDKLRKQKLKLLQQEVIEGDMEIDSNFNFLSEEVNTKIIKGNLTLNNFIETPEFIENIKVLGITRRFFTCNLDKIH